MKCPKCDKEDRFSAYRVRRLVEYKNIETRSIKLQYPKDTIPNGHLPYKGGSWIKDNDEVGDFISLRCNSCDERIERGEIKGTADYKIDPKKGLSFTTSQSARFLFGGDEDSNKSMREDEDRLKSAVRKYGKGGEDYNEDDIKENRRERVAEINGTLEDLGLDKTDMDTIRVFLGDVDIKNAYSEEIVVHKTPK